MLQKSLEKVNLEKAAKDIYNIAIKRAREITAQKTKDVIKIMAGKRDFYQVIEGMCAVDSRYKPDAYEFIMQALHFTQNKLKKQGHISGQELSEGIREYAIGQYGPLAKTVLTHWGITKTQDFGNIVFNLADKKMLSKTEADSIDDFKDIYDFEAAFGNVLRDSLIQDI